jgi:hypothetical protein
MSLKKRQLFTNKLKLIESRRYDLLRLAKMKQNAQNQMKRVEEKITMILMSRIDRFQELPCLNLR